MTAPARILVVDDHPLVLAGLEACLSGREDLSVVGTARDGHEAMAGVEEHRPDIVLVDYALPDMNGAELCAELTRTTDAPRVVALTSSDNLAVVTEFIRAGCSGFVVKDASSEAVLAALRTVAGGEVWFDPRVLVRMGRQELAPIELTPREMSVLRQMAAGHTYVEIARELHVSKGTVKNHVSSLLRKLNARRRSEAIAIAAKRGLL